MDKRDDQRDEQQLTDNFINELIKGDGIYHQDRLGSFIEANDVPSHTYKPGQVVRLKERYGDAQKGWIGIIVYYFSVALYPNLCQVLLYDPDDKDEDAYTGESVFDSDLEPLEPGIDTPFWFTFTVDREGFAVDRLEKRDDGESRKRGMAGDKSSKDQGTARNMVQRVIDKI